VLELLLEVAIGREIMCLMTTVLSVMRCPGRLDYGAVAALAEAVRLLLLHLHDSM
jgi:hypothetical protein